MSDADSPFAPRGPSDPPFPERSPIEAYWNPNVATAPVDDPGAILLAELATPAAPMKKPQPHLGWALLWMLLPIAAQFVAAIVVAIGAIGFFAIQGMPPEQWQSQLGNLEAVMLPAATLATVIAALLAAAIAFRRDLVRKLALRRCSIGQWTLVVLLVAPLAVVAGEIGNWATELLYALNLRDLATFGQDTFDNFSKQAWLVIFISACLFPGIGEEIFFRGFLSRGLVARHGVIWGSLFASALFGALHVAPVQVCATFVLGVGMQYLFLTTRSLFAPILLHVLNNTLAFEAMRHAEELPIEGVTESLTETAGVMHADWQLVAAALATVAAIAWVLYRSRTRWLLPQGEEWSPGYFATETPPAALGARPTTAWPGIAAVLALVIAYGLFIGAFALSAQSAT